MPLWTAVLDQILYVFDFGSVTSSSTNLSFSLCSTVHLVTLSAIVPEIFGNNEMDDELTGELVINKSVSPYELAGAEFVLVWLGPG